MAVTLVQGGATCRRYVIWRRDTWQMRVIPPLGTCPTLQRWARLQSDPPAQAKGARLVAVTSVQGCRLSAVCDLAVHLPLERELCPFDLAPVTSTAAQMLFGDTVAIALMQVCAICAELTDMVASMALLPFTVQELLQSDVVRCVRHHQSIASAPNRGCDAPHVQKQIPLLVSQHRIFW